MPIATNSTVSSLILHRLALVTQKQVADALGTDSTHISKFQSGTRGIDLDQIGPLLDSLGLKIVDVSDIHVAADEWAAVKVLGSKYFLSGQR